MSKIHYYEKIIQEKRKKTPFREFLMEIASWLVLNMYKNKGQISKYPDTARSPHIDNKDFLNNEKYALDYDNKSDFFTNYHTLLKTVSLQNISGSWSNENADFCDAAFGVKNGYLSFVAGAWVENIAYSAFCYIELTNIYNSLFVNSTSSNIYFSAWVTNSHNIFYSKYITQSSNIWFSTNLIGCQECIICNELQNQSYCFQNKQYTKEEYFIKKNELLQDKLKFDEIYKSISENRPISYLSENAAWTFNIKDLNVENAYWTNHLSEGRNVAFSWWGNGCTHFYDSVDVGIDSHDFYGVCGAGENTDNIYCSIYMDRSSHIFYSWFMGDCSFCLGCIGLKNKSYCILNKQYSKEEWYKKVEEIFSQMEIEGTLWDFFPGKINPYYFNDTLAYLIDNSFTKEEVESSGYVWRDAPINADIPEEMTTIRSTELVKYQQFNQNGEWRINPEILQMVIVDEKGNYYRIVKMEYDFLMKYALPLPTTHWLDRIKMGFNI